MKMQKLRQLLRPSGFKVGLGLTVLSLAIYAMGFPFLNTVELKAYDLHFLSRGKTQPGSEVVIATIDEKSIDRIGRWPWPRTKIAELIDKLGRYGARVVAFDVFFSEPDQSSGAATFQDLQARVTDRAAKAALEAAARAADNDARMTTALRRNQNVTLGYFFYLKKEDNKFRKVKTGSEAEFILPSSFSSIR
ncbi:MAG TPA: CHASE2 domain-containing protein, partial [Nitrospirota bacterium]